MQSDAARTTQFLYFDQLSRPQLIPCLAGKLLMSHDHEQNKRVDNSGRQPKFRLQYRKVRSPKRGRGNRPAFLNALKTRGRRWQLSLGGPSPVGLVCWRLSSQSCFDRSIWEASVRDRRGSHQSSVKRIYQVCVFAIHWRRRNLRITEVSPLGRTD